MASRRRFRTIQSYGTVELMTVPTVDGESLRLAFAAEYGDSGHISGARTLEKLARAILAEVKPKPAKGRRR